MADFRAAPDGDAMPGVPGSVFAAGATATRIEGVLAVGAGVNGQQYTAHDVRLLVSITNLVAGSLERQQLEAAAGRVEAFREAERVKEHPHLLRLA